MPTMDQPGFYRIRVQDELNEDWMDRLKGMEIVKRAERALTPEDLRPIRRLWPVCWRLSTS